MNSPIGRFYDGALSALSAKTLHECSDSSAAATGQKPHHTMQRKHSL